MTKMTLREATKQLVTCIETTKGCTTKEKALILDLIREGLVGYLTLKDWVIDELNEEAERNEHE
jgi:hypothetical protein